MSQPITIGIDFGGYTFVNDTRVITLTDLDGFVPTQAALAYVLNETQDIIYYAPSPPFMRSTVDGVTIILDDESKPTLKTDDILHIQFFYPTALPIYNEDLGIWESPVSLVSKVCVDNTTITPLNAGATFPGGWQNTLEYGTASVVVKSDQASAIDGLEIQWSSDGATVHDTDVFSINANSGKTFSFGNTFSYIRIQYTNGGVTQGSFNLETILHRTYLKPSSHRIQDNIIDEDDAELVKNVNTGEDINGVFRNIKSTPDGSMFVTDFLLEVAKGNIPGHSFDRKFGAVPGVQAATPADVWEYGATPGAEIYTFSTVADIDSISSSNNGDTEEITITGLDTDFNEVTQIKALQGQSRVVLDTTLIRVNRAYNSNGADLLGNVYIYVNTAISGGVPTDVTKVRGYISIGNGQTLQSIYTVPAGKTGYFMGLEAALTKGVGSTAVSALFTGRTREIGKVKRIRDTFTLISTGSSSRDVIFPISLPFPEKTDFIPTVDVSANNLGFSLSFSILLIDN